MKKIVIGSLSGGVVYHARALLYSRNLWSSHLQGTKAFLNSLDLHGREHLILVGPSGGYSLPSDWLKKFSIIDVYEPDPLARVILKRRHRLKNVNFFGHFNAAVYRKIEKLPNAFVLFSNVLGQKDLKFFGLPSLKKAVSNLAIASYHDALSVELPMKYQGTKKAKIRVDFFDLIRKSWKEANKKVVINEHRVPSANSNLQFYGGWVWQLTPTRLHWIEAVYSANLVR